MFVQSSVSSRSRLLVPTPHPLRPAGRLPGQQEFRYSLKTKDPHKTKEKARLKVVRLDEEFAAARIRKQRAAHVKQAASAPLPPLELSDLEIDRLALLYLQEILRMSFCLPLEKN